MVVGATGACACMMVGPTGARTHGSGCHGACALMMVGAKARARTAVGAGHARTAVGAQAEGGLPARVLPALQRLLDTEAGESRNTAHMDGSFMRKFR